MEIKIGAYRIYIENRNGSEIAICPECGVDLNYRHLQTVMPSAETGFFYCSEKCAIEHTKKMMEDEKEE